MRKPHALRRRFDAANEGVLAFQPWWRAFDRRRRGPRRGSRIGHMPMVWLIVCDRTHERPCERRGARTWRCARPLIHPPVIICIENSDEAREARWRTNISRFLAGLASTKPLPTATTASLRSCLAANPMTRSSSMLMKSEQSACLPGSDSSLDFDTRNELADLVPGGHRRRDSA